jgi:acetyl esterase
VKDLLLRGVARIATTGPAASVIGRRRQRGADAGLDPQVAAVLELQRLMRLPRLESMDPPAARRFAEEGLSPLEVAHEGMDEVLDTTVAGRGGHGIPVRVYRPYGAGPSWIVYLHGGGGVIGSIRSCEPIVRRIAAQTGCTVASVEYRLGPEHRHPSAVEDACDAYAAIAARVPGAGKIAVAGDSFGGFLSAHVDRAVARKPDAQLLIYPLLDMTMSGASIERCADGYLLTKSMMTWFRTNYLHPDDDRRAVSPRYWPSLRGAAPAIVVTAGYDPLVDEGDAYAEALAAAQVAVRHRRHASLVHGFLSLAGAVDAARAAVDEMCADVRDLLR